MTRPKRFRGLELTEDDLWCRINEHIGNVYDPDGYGYGRQSERLAAKAKRLLPLWRKWAIERERLKPSPWRSLRDDQPEPPTEETAHALLVRANPRDRDLLV